MNKLHWRAVAGIAIMVATIAAFIWYFGSHPAVRHQLANTSPAVILILLGLYLLSIVVLAFVNAATIRLCDLKLSMGENILIAAYNAVINFFGPLQSGPAFRAAYLKKKYDVNIKKYAGATLVYYFFFGLWSSVCLVAGLLKWWTIPILVIGLLLLHLVLNGKWRPSRLRGLDLRGIYYLALVALAQVVVIVLINYTELRTVAPGTHVLQAIVYTGAYSLALFVSITPGAIGFRESFLLFSRHLSGVSSSTIVAASILDRSMYIILLLILAAFIFATHAKKHLGVSRAAD